MAFKMIRGTGEGFDYGEGVGASPIKKEIRPEGPRFETKKKKLGPIKGKVGSELRKKEYDARGWAYDDTIATTKKPTMRKELKTKTKPTLQADLTTKTREKKPIGPVTPNADLTTKTKTKRKITVTKKKKPQYLRPEILKRMDTGTFRRPGYMASKGWDMKTGYRTGKDLKNKKI